MHTNALYASLPRGTLSAGGAGSELPLSGIHLWPQINAVICFVGPPTEGEFFPDCP
jgi:hypothetical protein